MMKRWSGTEMFERAVVLRGARVIYLFMAMLATLAIVGALGGLAYSVTPVVKGFAPQEPPPLDEVIPDPSATPRPVAQRPTERASSSAPASPVAGGPARLAAPPDALRAERDALWAALRERFDTTSPPWIDRIEQTCELRDWTGFCMRWRSEVRSQGLVRRLEASVSSHDLYEEVTILRSLDGLLTGVDAEEVELARVLLAGLSVVEAFGPEGAVALDALVTATPLGGDQRVGAAGLVAALPLAGGAPDDLTAWVSIVAPHLASLPPAVAISTAPRTWMIVSAYERRQREAAEAVVQGLRGAGPDGAARWVDGYYERVLAERRDAERERAEAMTSYMAAVATREAAAAAGQAMRVTVRGMSIVALPAALGVLALLGIGIAVLALERNTRAIRDLAIVKGATPE